MTLPRVIALLILFRSTFRVHELREFSKRLLAESARFSASVIHETYSSFFIGG